MKITHFILFAAIALVFSSCKLSNSSESTPGFYFVQIAHIVGNDTTDLKLTGNTLDTISVGDTISFRTVIYSEYNRLLQYNISSSRKKSVEFIWSPEETLDSIFSSTSNYDNGEFVMGDSYSQLYFPFKYVAKEEESDLKLTFSIISDASSRYSTTTFTIITPIKAVAKPQEDN